jgi:O-antigen/teichoic acid export membrane protein
VTTPEQTNEPRREANLPGDQAIDRPPQASTFLHRAVRNFLFSGLGTLSNFVIGFLFAGLTIRYLGEARAGYFMALAALTGFGSLIGDLGLGTPAVRRVSVLNAEKNFLVARQVIGSVFTISFSSALVVAVPILIFFPSVFQWSRLDGAFFQDAFWATVFSLATFVLTQSSNSWRSAFNALERFDLLSSLSAGFGLLSGILGIAVLKFFPSMWAISLLRLGLAITRSSIEAVLMRRLVGGIPWFQWKWQEIRPMMKFGGWVYFGTLGQFLLGRANSLVLTTYLGTASLPYYELPQRVYNQIHGALGAQSQILVPMFASYGDDAKVHVARLEDRLRWLVAFVSSAAYTVVALLGPVVLGKIVNERFAELVLIPLYLACIQGFFAAQDIVYYYSTWSVGIGRFNALYVLSLGCMVILTSLVLIPASGYVGASIAQLWVVCIVSVYVAVSRKIFVPGAGLFGWMSVLASPVVMACVWVVAANILKSLLGHNFWSVLLATLVGGGIGVAALLVIETKMFPEMGRIQMVRKILLSVTEKVRNAFFRFRVSLREQV